MKVLKRLFWVLVGILGLSFLAISVYGLGQDMVSFLPMWLTEVIVGMVFLFFFLVIVILVGLGILHIKGWCKEASNG